MKEFIQSLFETSNERIKNPFIGSYITAFIVYNWRPLFLLIFSEANIEDKIVVINHEYCAKEAILWPLAIALFYILILPYINLLFDYVLSFSNTKKDERKRDSILNNLKNKKAEAKYEREIAEERAGTREVKELQDKIETLEKENELKTREITEFSSTSNSAVEQLQLELEQLGGSNLDLELKLQNEKNENNEIKEIYDLLINPKSTAIRDIKNFFRGNLNNDQFVALRDRAENKNSIYATLPLHNSYNALLLKAKVFEIKESPKGFKITEDGIKFVQDLE